MRNLSWLIPFISPVATYGNVAAKPSRYSHGDKISEDFLIQNCKIGFY